MAISASDIENRLQTTLKRVGLDQLKLNENRLDSLQLIDLMLAIEKEFHFEFDPAEYDPQSFASYNKLLFFIERTMGLSET